MKIQYVSLFYSYKIFMDRTPVTSLHLGLVKMAKKNIARRKKLAAMHDAQIDGSKVLRDSKINEGSDEEENNVLKSKRPQASPDQMANGQFPSGFSQEIEAFRNAEENYKSMKLIEEEKARKKMKEVVSTISKPEDLFSAKEIIRELRNRNDPWDNATNDNYYNSYRNDVQERKAQSIWQDPSLMHQEKPSLPDGKKRPHTASGAVAAKKSVSSSSSANNKRNYLDDLCPNILDVAASMDQQQKERNNARVSATRSPNVRSYNAAPQPHGATSQRPATTGSGYRPQLPYHQVPPSSAGMTPYYPAGQGIASSNFSPNEQMAYYSTDGQMSWPVSAATSPIKHPSTKNNGMDGDLVADSSDEQHQLRLRKLHAMRKNVSFVEDINIIEFDENNQMISIGMPAGASAVGVNHGLLAQQHGTGESVPVTDSSSGVSHDQHHKTGEHHHHHHPGTGTPGSNHQHHDNHHHQHHDNHHHHDPHDLHHVQDPHHEPRHRLTPIKTTNLSPHASSSVQHQSHDHAHHHQHRTLSPTEGKEHHSHHRKSHQQSPNSLHSHNGFFHGKPHVRTVTDSEHGNGSNIGTASGPSSGKASSGPSPLRRGSTLGFIYEEHLSPSNLSHEEDASLNDLLTKDGANVTMDDDNFILNVEDILRALKPHDEFLLDFHLDIASKFPFFVRKDGLIPELLQCRDIPLTICDTLGKQVAVVPVTVEVMVYDIGYILSGGANSTNMFSTPAPKDRPTSADSNNFSVSTGTFSPLSSRPVSAMTVHTPHSMSSYSFPMVSPSGQIRLPRLQRLSMTLASLRNHPVGLPTTAGVLVAVRVVSCPTPDEAPPELTERGLYRDFTDAGGFTFLSVNQLTLRKKAFPRDSSILTVLHEMQSFAYPYSGIDHVLQHNPNQHLQGTNLVNASTNRLHHLFPSTFGSRSSFLNSRPNVAVGSAGTESGASGRRVLSAGDKHRMGNAGIASTGFAPHPTTFAGQQILLIDEGQKHALVYPCLLDMSDAETIESLVQPILSTLRLEFEESSDTRHNIPRDDATPMMPAGKQQSIAVPFRDSLDLKLDDTEVGSDSSQSPHAAAQRTASALLLQEDKPVRKKRASIRDTIAMIQQGGLKYFDEDDNNDFNGASSDIKPIALKVRCL